MFIRTLLVTLFFGTHCDASQPHIPLDRAAYADGAEADNEQDDEQSESQSKRSRISPERDDAQSEDAPTEFAAEDEVAVEEEELLDPQSLHFPELVSYIGYLIDEKSFFNYNNTVAANYRPYVRELHKRIHKTRIETKGHFCEAQNMLFNIIGENDPILIRYLQRTQ